MQYYYCPKCDNEHDQIEVEDTLDSGRAICPDCGTESYEAGSVPDPRTIED